TSGKTSLQAIQGYAADSDQPQAIVQYMRALDSYNWGYDPFHYGAPEGSYASTADGTAKIVEFRKMVKGLSDAGLRVALDVVYNHTNAAGPSQYSVLDKVVPGYYHRLDPKTGYVLSSSCCANTATEHHMMGKLMVDTLARSARDYQLGAFRFDLMGLHLKSDIEKVQAALQALTLAADGVDGSKIYLYGEGWDSGEMAHNALGVNASQLNMAGTGVGTFNDRIRDAARGGGPFDNGCDLTKSPVQCDIRKKPAGRSAADRVRADELAIDVAMLGEGVPFFAMGDDILRSKSMDKNSYDSGDWFNRVDWTGQSNGWRSGLPNQPDDSANWGLI